MNGLPNATQKIDNPILEKIKALKVDQVIVQGNFKRFDLLDENVKLVCMSSMDLLDNRNISKDLGC